MFIGACAQINILETVFVGVSAFVMKTSHFIEHNFTEKSLLVFSVSNCHGIFLLAH